MTFRVAARPRIAIPVPSAAYARTAFDDLGVEPQFVAQAVQLVHAGKARANNNGINALDSC